MASVTICSDSGAPKNNINCFHFSLINVELTLKFNIVQFICSVKSDSLRPHESQQARFPCLSQTPSSLWCHPAISSSDVPFSSCPQSLPVSESFPKSQSLAWGGQNTGYLQWYEWASLVAQMVKNPSAMQETRIQPLGQEDPLEKGMATCSSMVWIVSVWRKTIKTR